VTGWKQQKVENERGVEEKGERQFAGSDLTPLISRIKNPAKPASMSEHVKEVALHLEGRVRMH
jgi:hypothetical protein